MARVFITGSTDGLGLAAAPGFILLTPAEIHEYTIDPMTPHKAAALPAG